MLEQGHERGRGEIAFDRAEHEIEEGARQVRATGMPAESSIARS